MIFRQWKMMFGMAAALALAACGNAPQGAQQGTTTAGATTTTPTSTPANLALVSNAYTLKTDNSNSVTLTAILTDASSAAVSNATVTFTATSGSLSAPSAVTDPYGKASVTFSSGLIDKSNRTATVTASYGALSAQVPIVISGTTLTLNAGTTNLVTNGAPDTLTVTVLDAGGNPVYNTPVSFTVTGAGAATVTAASANTDVNGQVTATVQGTAAGAVSVQVDAAGATATQSYTISGAATAFGITAPTADPYTMLANTPLTVTVNAPGVATVRFVSSLGSWSATGTGIVDVAVAGGVASAMLTSPSAGVATVQVLDKANPSTSDTLSVVFAQPASAASQITIQSSANVVAPSQGGQTSTTSLTAKVTDPTGQPVADAPVLFYIKNPSGSGESVAPAYALTDGFGLAQATFTAGASATAAQGVDVYAQLANVASVYDSVNIVVGGQAASLFIGTGTVLPDLNPATYKLPMSVLVTDGNGNAVSGATVSLKAWPLYYAIGPACGPALASFPNEDLNRNNLLDPGEDVGISIDLYTSSQTGDYVLPSDPYAVYSRTLSGGPDGRLTPPSASAGSVPASVVTDQNGVATFDLVYQKTSAIWIKTEITASTQVLGTESQSRVAFWLSPSVPDVGPPCKLTASPFNPPGF
ncbi:MAG: Ig-like domain-containing protein [Mariprofundaceae bacterium]